MIGCCLRCCYNLARDICVEDRRKRSSGVILVTKLALLSMGAATVAQPPANKGEFEKKKQKFIVRAIWTFVMIGLFVGIVLAGHVYLAILIAALQVLSFREVISITASPLKNIPWGRTLSWYFLIVIMFYLKAQSLFGFFHNVGIWERVLWPVMHYHVFLSYSLYMVGFLVFVSTLTQATCREQYAHFCATHLALLMVVAQGHFIESNILHGLFWFLVPVSLVIVNDIGAYVCGITMGRRPLIEISPKKTKEGFVGAWICTVIFGVFITHVAYSSDYMICPMDEIGVNAFSNHTCEPNPVFIPREWRLFGYSATFPSIYFHVALLSTFASLIAPFGGFFASGFKRAFKVKDFGDTIPGHGGIVDRFDCQFIMGMFSYIYYTTFVALPDTADYRGVVTAAYSLGAADKKQLVADIQRILTSENNS